MTPLRTSSTRPSGERVTATASPPGDPMNMAAKNGMDRSAVLDTGQYSIQPRDHTLISAVTAYAETTAESGPAQTPALQTPPVPGMNGGSFLLGEQRENPEQASRAVDGQDVQDPARVLGNGMTGAEFPEPDSARPARVFPDAGDMAQEPDALAWGADRAIMDGNNVGGLLDLDEGTHLVELPAVISGTIMDNAPSGVPAPRLNGHEQDVFNGNSVFSGPAAGQAALLEDIFPDLMDGNGGSLEITDEMLGVFLGNKAPEDVVTIHVRGEAKVHVPDHVNAEYLAENGWTAEYQSGSTVLTNPSEDVRLIIETGLL